MADVLVLSSGYEPLSRVSWRRAVGWLLDGRVEVLSTHTDKFIHTVTEAIPMPAVVRFVGRVVRRWVARGVKFNRDNVYARDGGRCQYCNSAVPFKEFEYEHVTPRSHGGLTCWTNIVTACTSCNKRKANRTPEQAGMKLARPPKRPTAAQMSSNYEDMAWQPGEPESWREWLFG